MARCENLATWRHGKTALSVARRPQTVSPCSPKQKYLKTKFHVCTIMDTLDGCCRAPSRARDATAWQYFISVHPLDGVRSQAKPTKILWRVSFFLGRNWPVALVSRQFPAQFPNEIERTGDEDNVFGSGDFECASQSFRRIRHNFRAARMMRCHFRQ